MCRPRRFGCKSSITTPAGDERQVPKSAVEGFDIIVRLLTTKSDGNVRD
jgi:hypothetical protein